MKSKIKHLVTRLILPRGFEYRMDQQLEIGWEKQWLKKGNKSICVLHKRPGVDSKGIIILAHPYLAEAKQFFLRQGHAHMYHDLGYDVILFDFNGFGESPFTDFAFEDDIHTVADHFKSLYPDKRMYGHGVSFGASHTITYSTLSSHHFSKIVIENCLDSNLTYYHKRNKKLFYLMKLLMAILPGVNKNHDYVEGASKLRHLDDILLIYNQDDDLTTKEMGQQILEKSSIKGNMVLLKGKHLDAYQKNTAKYTKIINDFLHNE